MLSFTTLSLVFNLFALIRTQQNGDSTPEAAPKLTMQTCTKTGCQPVDGVATIDANWRWAYNKDKKNCYKGNLWDPESCPTGKDCAANCFLDGADYKASYGVESTGTAITLKFVTKGPYGDVNFGSRLYFSTGEKYRMFQLKNQEFTFTVDVSKLPCGLNGALYFAGMPEDGGASEQNKAGAPKGTGYCDAQCPQDVKWIDGQANSDGWKPSPTDPNSGTGNRGVCCCEMDIWEANSISQAFTPHPSKEDKLVVCEGKDCANGEGDRYKGIADKDGCDFASYRYGQKDFYGPSKTVDTGKKFTVITQFITKDGTDKGELSEIRRLYVQDGKLIKNQAVTIPGASKPFDSITQEFCDATKVATKDVNDFKAKGGMSSMDKCLNNGMVLVLSLWDDHAAEMKWLDSNYPPTKAPTQFGVARGTCPADAGNPKTVRADHADASVEFSDIKIGAIGTTFKGDESAATSTVPTSTSGTGRRRKCRG